MEGLEKDILATLCYGDIFNYPLKAGEIEKYLINLKSQISNGKTKSKILKLTIERLIREGKVEKKGEYYFLKEREGIVELREKRRRWSEEKVEKAKKVANLLKLIPWVKLVGISGALAMENSDEDDDIDLFIITSSGRLWLTRFLVTVLVELVGQRRRPLLLNPKFQTLNPKQIQSTNDQNPKQTVWDIGILNLEIV